MCHNLHVPHVLNCSIIDWKPEGKLFLDLPYRLLLEQWGNAYFATLSSAALSILTPIAAVTQSARC